MYGLLATFNAFPKTCPGPSRKHFLGSVTLLQLLTRSLELVLQDQGGVDSTPGSENLFWLMPRAEKPTSVREATLGALEQELL